MVLRRSVPLLRRLAVPLRRGLPVLLTAAAQNNPKAQTALGIMYYVGRRLAVPLERFLVALLLDWPMKSCLSVNPR